MPKQQPQPQKQPKGGSKTVAPHKELQLTTMIIGNSRLSPENFAMKAECPQGKPQPLKVNLLVPAEKSNGQAVKSTLKKIKEEGDQPIHLLFVEEGEQGDHLRVAYKNHPTAVVVKYDTKLTKDFIQATIKNRIKQGANFSASAN